MKNNFVTKLETKNCLIGSFDAYLEESKSLMMYLPKINADEVENMLKKMPTTSRATILNKEGNYIGFIGLIDVDMQNNESSLILGTNNNLCDLDKNEILDVFKEYAKMSLNVKNIRNEMIFEQNKFENKVNVSLPKHNIIIPQKFLKVGISLEDAEKYSIPKLQMPCTIKNKDKTIGVIGAVVSWPNQRANINLYLDNRLGEDLIKELEPSVFNEYLNYIHSQNIHSVILPVNGSNKNLTRVLEKTNMNYCASIPYGTIHDDKLETMLLFQHIPNMKHDSNIIIPDNESCDVSLLRPKKAKMDDVIDLGNGIKMVSPMAFDTENIDYNRAFRGYFGAMQNRKDFTIPLGEDKYIPQIGNEFYGMTKAFSKFSYITLDESDNYLGHVGIIRKNADGYNTEIEIAVSPYFQRQGIGRQELTAFYDQSFQTGCSSVTSSVFAFNNPSIGLHNGCAEYCGKRDQAYYFDGRLRDIYIYSKINQNIKGKVK